MRPLVDQVPVVVDRVRREIVLARFIGKLAVDQGLRELRTRLESDSPQGAEARRQAPMPSARLEAEGAPGTRPLGAQTVELTDDGFRPDAGSLALADYDQLPASDILAMLPGLEPDERAAIAVYERAVRHRRTVLGKIEQLGNER